MNGTDTRGKRGTESQATVIPKRKGSMSLGKKLTLEFPALETAAIN